MNDSGVFLAITDFSVLLSFAPLLIALINFKFLDRVIMPFFVLVLISAIVEVVNVIYINSNENNFFLLHFYSVFEFSLISLFYIFFFRQYFNAIIFKLMIPVFVVVAIIDYSINGLSSIDNFSISIESLLLTSYSLFFFYYILKNLLFENLLASPIFWLNTAVLIYFPGNLILFLFSNHLIATKPEEYLVLWAVIHSFLNIMYNILLAIGFWKIRAR